MIPEMARPVTWRSITGGERTFLVEATAAECARIAMRLDIPAVAALECRFQITGLDDVSAVAEGFLKARLTRTCVVSADDFETAVEADFLIRFVVAGHEKADIDLDDVDEVPFDGMTIDFGEAAVEQLALSLDPYPRIEGAEAPSVADEANQSPFAILARRDRG